MHQSTRRRGEHVTAQRRSKEASEDGRRLRCRIEDLRCIIDLLRKRLAELRRNGRPNVPLMMKQLNTLRRKERVALGAVRPMAIIDSRLDELVGFQRDAAAPEVLELLKGRVETVQQEVADLKQTATVEWSVTKREMLGAAELAMWEIVRDQLNAALCNVKMESERVAIRIGQMQRMILAKGMLIPEPFV
jgi:hypothetical protein